MTRKAKELTLEEKAIKYEQQRLKQAQHCKNWVTKNREKQREISAVYYANNKINHNQKCVIYSRNRREALKLHNLENPEVPNL
jgi:hypothetical protein